MKRLREVEVGGRAGALLAKCQRPRAFSSARAKSRWVCIRKTADPQHKISPAGLAELGYKCAVYQGKSILWCQKIVGVALIIFQKKNTFKVKKEDFLFYLKGEKSSRELLSLVYMPFKIQHRIPY